jgi:hypothetical protein
LIKQYDSNKNKFTFYNGGKKSPDSSKQIIYFDEFKEVVAKLLSLSTLFKIQTCEPHS